MPPRKTFDRGDADLRRARQQAKVSDHAVIRWLERVDRWEIAAIREAMLTEAVLHAMALGASQVTVDGLTYCLSDHTITTVFPAGGKR